MLKQDLQEQIDELRDRIKILEARTVKLVKVGPSPYDLQEMAKLQLKVDKRRVKTRGY